MFMAELLNIIAVGSQGDSKGIEKVSRTLMPPKPKQITNDVAKKLRNRMKKR